MPRSTNWFSVLETCTLEITRDMLHPPPIPDQTENQPAMPENKPTIPTPAGQPPPPHIYVRSVLYPEPRHTLGHPDISATILHPLNQVRGIPANTKMNTPTPKYTHQHRGINYNINDLDLGPRTPCCFLPLVVSIPCCFLPCCFHLLYFHLQTCFCQGNTHFKH